MRKIGRQTDLDYFKHSSCSIVEIQDINTNVGYMNRQICMKHLSYLQLSKINQSSSGIDGKF